MKRYKLINSNTNYAHDIHYKTLVGGNFGNLLEAQNPKWPPVIGKIIIAKSPNYKETFIGKIFQNVWNNTSSVIFLMNNKDYVEETLKTYEIVPGEHGGRGLFLLLPSYGWQYITKSALSDIMKMYGNLDNISDINTSVKIGYDQFIQNLDNINPKINGTSTNLPSDIALSSLTDHRGYYDDIELTKKSSCGSSSGDVSGDMFDETNINDDSLLKQGDINFDMLFKEKEINIILGQKNKAHDVIDLKIKDGLLNKLKLFEEIKLEESNIIVNENIAVNDLIKDKKDEINEGNKIIEWVRSNFSSKITKKDGKTSIFNDLKGAIFNGYVYFMRSGIDVNNNITPELVPNLQHFTWQYNIPIDYNTLKYVLFQNRFQKTISQDNEQQKEAEQILSQEYIVSLQPEPKYQLWCLKRLLLCWYADDILNKHIRKIKVVINQWRCRNDQSYNVKNGILPSIVIYPNYGQESARLVISQLSYYFSLYKNIGWVCSTPSYFIKTNTLIYYTNGSLDLKLYYRKTKSNYNAAVGNDSFSAKYTKMINADTVMYPND